MGDQRVVVGAPEFDDICPSPVGRNGVDAVQVDDVALVAAEEHVRRQALFQLGQRIAGDVAPSILQNQYAGALLALDEQYGRNVDEAQPVAVLEHQPSGGGGSSSTAEKTYTVKFNSNGGSTVEKVTVKKNETVAEPTAPTRVGYTFEGWYTDSKLTKEYNFETPVTKSFALYAKWTEVPKGDEPIVEDPVIEDPTIIGEFTDVMENDWFASSVDFVVENKLMAGVSGGKFAPDVTLTRAMLVTVLYRLEGEPATNRSIPFADVDMGAYYANAVSWAKQNGIVAGISENEFAPDLNITREQIASIMFRYAKFKGYDVSASADITSYNDAGKVSDWATESMKYAVGSGLIMGKTETTLNPLDNATRAEFAAIMQRFVTKNK